MRSFGKRFAQACRHVIGGRDEAAEDDRVGALGDERLQQLDHRFEFRIRPLWRALRPAATSSASGPACSRPGGGLDIDRVGLVGVVIEDLLLEPIGISSEAIAQRARGGGGRRTDAAHQRQCAPEGEPSPALVRAGALDDAEAVVEHGVVECAVLGGQVVGTSPLFRGAGRRAPRPNRGR